MMDSKNQWAAHRPRLWKQTSGRLWMGLGALACIATQPFAQTACKEPAATDFTAVSLVSTGLTEVDHLAVASDGRVFIAEMKTGKIKVYNPTDKSVSEVGTIPIRFENEDGLLGIAVPPDFVTSNFLYAFFTQPSTTARAHELARFTIVNNKLGDKKTMLTVPRVAQGQWHAAGGMAFDTKGNLIISTGDDTNPHAGPNDGFGAIYWRDPVKDAQKSAANSNDLRGKVLRIHPEPDGTYTIPPGNLVDRISTLVPSEDATKVRKEIYAMGMRNPYKPGVDAVTGWIWWGEVGPDADADVSTRGRSGHDEFNMATKANFFGWPYVNGNQFVYNNVDYSGGTTGVPGAKFDINNLTNTSSNNTGITKLPSPPVAPVIWYAAANKSDWQEMGAGAETAMGGPMYRYDVNLKSTTKFPPWFEGKIIFWDWSRRVYKTLTFDETGKLTKSQDFKVNGLDWGSMISMQYGPEGSLYALKYSGGGYGSIPSNPGQLWRIDYKGTYDDACYKQFAPNVSSLQVPRTMPGRSFLITSAIRSVPIPKGAQSVSLFGLDGRLVLQKKLDGSQPSFDMASLGLSQHEMFEARFEK